MLNPVLRFTLSACFVGALPSAIAAGFTTEDFSLQLSADAPARAGHFPMGFVRGDPALTVAAGYSQVQDVAMMPDFAQGAPYLAASAYLDDPRDLRYFSLALPADSLESLLVAGAQSGRGVTAASKRFGAFSLAQGPDGKPYALPQFKTRELAKIRDLVDIFDPATRRYLRAYVKAHVESRVKSPVDQRVLRWGLDNEWEAPPNYTPAARELFLKWLQASYAGNIAALNAAWGANFTAFDVSVVADLPAPKDYAARPGAFLDWYAFSTEAFLQAMLDQVRTMHEADPRKRGVVNKATQLTLEMPATSRLRLFDHGRFAELVRPYSGGYYGIDMYGAGDRQAYETNYIFNSIRPEDRAPGYGVMLAETNNHNGPGHQFASTSWRLLANGAKSLMHFTPGFVGAPKGSDWDHFAMIDRVTGRPRDKWFYAARWAAAVHRSEKFWSDAVPAPGLPRLAMLVPRRDILLAERSDRNPGEGRYAYPRNHRWMVYRWLREQGYWVDVLPYEKLTPAYLRAYAGLVLVGAEHLAPQETAVIAQYVADGGVLVGDTAPGYFDQHHLVRGGLASIAGVEAVHTKEMRAVEFRVGGRCIAGVSAYRTKAVTAQVLARDAQESVLAALQDYQRGKILSLPFELGSLVVKDDRSAVATQQSDHAPTAGSEQYDAHAGEFLVGEWLAQWLRRAGLKPAYTAQYPSADAARVLRIEQPYVDEADNVALVIGNRAQLNPQEHLPAGTVELVLPQGEWTAGWWAAAEDESLSPVSLTLLADGRHRVTLPAIASMGILYLFNHHEPLLGVSPITTAHPLIAGRAPQVAPHEKFALTVQLINPTGAALPAGTITLRVPDGWSVNTPTVPTPTLAAGGLAAVEVEVTAGAGGVSLEPDRLYPVIARWSDGKKDRAIITAQVEGIQHAEDAWRLLTDNAPYPENYPYRLATGATYRHVRPAAGKFVDPQAAQPNAAAGRGSLLDGFGSIAGERNSFNRSDYVKRSYVKYAESVAEVVFDLRAARELQRVNVVAGPEPVTVKKLSVFTSDDGKQFTLRDTVTPTRPVQESVILLAGVRARFVKLRAEWPAAGGTLDEVEIWGR